MTLAFVNTKQKTISQMIFLIFIWMFMLVMVIWKIKFNNTTVVVNLCQISNTITSIINAYIIYFQDWLSLNKNTYVIWCYMFTVLLLYLFQQKYELYSSVKFVKIPYLLCLLFYLRQNLSMYSINIEIYDMKKSGSVVSRSQSTDYYLK